MSESHSAHGAPAPVPYASPLTYSTRPPTMMRLGGALGIAGSSIGIVVFLAACAGYDAAFYLSPIPVGLGAVGLVLATVGGILERDRITEDTHTMAAIFAAIISLIGGLFELTAWLGWRTFSK